MEARHLYEPKFYQWPNLLQILKVFHFAGIIRLLLTWCGQKRFERYSCISCIQLGKCHFTFLKGPEWVTRSSNPNVQITARPLGLVSLVRGDINLTKQLKDELCFRSQMQTLWQNSISIQANISHEFFFLKTFHRNKICCGVQATLGLKILSGWLPGPQKEGISQGDLWRTCAGAPAPTPSGSQILIPPFFFFFWQAFVAKEDPADPYTFEWSVHVPENGCAGGVDSTSSSIGATCWRPRFWPANFGKWTPWLFGSCCPKFLTW